MTVLELFVVVLLLVVVLLVLERLVDTPVLVEAVVICVWVREVLVKRLHALALKMLVVVVVICVLLELTRCNAEGIDVFSALGSGVVVGGGVVEALPLLTLVQTCKKPTEAIHSA